jgi:carbamoyl-phosphate synthase large subunit
MLGNILVTSSSKKVPLIESVKNALFKVSPDSKVIAGDINNNVITGYLDQNFWLMPASEDSNLEDIICGCKEKNITVVFPTRDGELLFWAKNKLQFEKENIRIITSSASIIKKCLDKYYFFQECVSLNIPVIPTDIKINNTDYNKYVVKERFGSSKNNLIVNVDKKSGEEFSKSLSNPIFQQYINGEEISVDAWIHNNNKVKGIILRKRNLISSGESQVTTTFRNSEYEAFFSDVILKLELTGHVVFQAIIDKTQCLHIIECNPRFGGASTASIEAGLDSIYWSLFEAVFPNKTLPPFNRIDKEVMQIRFPQDTYKYDINS